MAQTAFNRAAANAMLDQNGDRRNAKCGSAPDGAPYREWKDGSCLVVNIGTTSDDPTRVKVESMLQSDLAAVGIRVPMPFTPNVASAMFFGAFADGGTLYTHAFDIAMFALTYGLPGDPATLATSFHGDCGGSCPEQNQIPSAGNGGEGLNDTGVSDKQLDAALDKGGMSVDPGTRGGAYQQAEQRIAAVLPEIPLYQQLSVNTYTSRLQGVSDNDIVWDFDTADWSCAGGNCQG